jgi:hypothetical protein
MVINTYIIYESLERLLCYNIIGGVGVPVSLRHNGLSVVRIRGSSHIPPKYSPVHVHLVGTYSDDIITIDQYVPPSFTTPIKAATA